MCLEAQRDAQAAATNPQGSLFDVPASVALLSAPEPPVSAVQQQLAALDVDALTPREALALLYELQRSARDAAS